MESNWRRFFQLEPLLFFYMYSLLMAFPVYQQYVYYRVSKEVGLPYRYDKEKTHGSCTMHAGNSTNSSYSLLEKKVQTIAARIELGVTLFSILPSIFTAIIVGAWTEKAGRRVGIALPCLGSLIYSIFIITMIYKELPLWTMFVGSAINGMCGYMALFQVAVMAYIADSSELSKLSLRFALLQLVLFMGGMVAQLTSGWWLKTYGFIIPCWFIIACQMVSLLYATFLLPESRKETEENARFFSCYSFRKVFCIFKKNQARPSALRNLLILNLSFGILMMTVMGLISVNMLFILRSPLCLSATMVGYFMAYRFTLKGIGSVITVALFGRFLNQINIARLGLVSHIAALVFFGFSDRLWMIYLASVIGFFEGGVEPIYRAMMSRTVNEDQQGALFAVSAVIGTLFQLIGTLVFNGIYPGALEFGFPGFVFVLAGAFAIVPLVLMSCLREPSTLMTKERPMSSRHHERSKAASKTVTFKENDLVSDSTTSELFLSCETYFKDESNSQDEKNSNIRL